MTTQSKTLAERLADYAAKLTFEQLPKEVVHEAKRVTVDAIGCQSARGRKTLASRSDRWPTIFMVRPVTARRFGARSSRCLWIGRRCITGFAFDISITTTRIYQKSRRIRATTFPRAMPRLRSVSAHGRDLITAIVLAYEVQCRFADAVSIRAQGLGSRNIRRVLRCVGRVEDLQTR